MVKNDQKIQKSGFFWKNPHKNQKIKKKVLKVHPPQKKNPKESNKKKPKTFKKIQKNLKIWRQKPTSKIKEKRNAKKNRYSLSFPILEGRNLARVPKSSPFQNPRVWVPWAGQRRTDKRTEILVSNIELRGGGQIIYIVLLNWLLFQFSLYLVMSTVCPLWHPEPRRLETSGRRVLQN